MSKRCCTIATALLEARKRGGVKLTSKLLYGGSLEVGELSTRVHLRGGAPEHHTVPNRLDKLRPVILDDVMEQEFAQACGATGGGRRAGQGGGGGQQLANQDVRCFITLHVARRLIVRNAMHCRTRTRPFPSLQGTCQSREDTVHAPNEFIDTQTFLMGDCVSGLR